MGYTFARVGAAVYRMMFEEVHRSESEQTRDQ
jgi:hypothetical protein